MNTQRANKRIRGLTMAAAAGAAFLATDAVQAVPTQVSTAPAPQICDPLPPLVLVDELGVSPPFPLDERIDAGWQQIQAVACPMHDDPSRPNVVVRMINATVPARSFTDVYYVADPPDATGVAGTTISNVDGLVNQGQAFQIDTVGNNRPLIFESLSANGIFEPGEVWQFVIDDYQNGLGLPPSAFTSIGVGNVSLGGPSSGSIIAIPEPAAASAMLGVAGVAACIRRRRR